MECVNLRDRKVPSLHIVGMHTAGMHIVVKCRLGNLTEEPLNTQGLGQQVFAGCCHLCSSNDACIGVGGPEDWGESEAYAESGESAGSGQHVASGKGARGG